MTIRLKRQEMLERTAEVKRMKDILLPLQDGDRVCSNLCNVGFSVEHFFNPQKFASSIAEVYYA